MEAIQFQRASFGGTQDVRGEVARAEPLMADSELSNAEVLRGKVAIVSRGYVTFDAKAARVQEAGAVGMVVLNWANSVAVFDPAPGTGDDISIPVVCIRQDDGGLLPDGAQVAFVGDGVEAAKGPEQRATHWGRAEEPREKFAGFLEESDSSVGIQGVLGMKFHSLEEFDDAVGMFNSCMLSWQEQSLFSMPGQLSRSDQIASHGKHLEVAMRTRHALGDLEACNVRSVDNIASGFPERAVEDVRECLGSLHDAERDMVGRDALRTSLFEVPQHSYKVLQEALLATGQSGAAMAVASVGKARSLVHMMEDGGGAAGSDAASVHAASAQFAVGDKVRLSGLRVHTQYNGSEGVVEHVGETVLVQVDGVPEPMRFALRSVARVSDDKSLDATSADAGPGELCEPEWPDIQGMVREEGCTVVEYSWLLEGRLAVWVVSPEGELVCCEVRGEQTKREVEQLLRMVRASMGLGSGRAAAVVKAQGLGAELQGDGEAPETSRDGSVLISELVLLLQGGDELPPELAAELEAIRRQPARRRELDCALEECKAVRDWLCSLGQTSEWLHDAATMIAPSAESWAHLKMVVSSEEVLAAAYGVRDPSVVAELWERVAMMLDETRLLRELDRILVAPVAHALSGADEVLLVPHENLFSVPWTALVDESGRYLIERFAVRVSPSLRVARAAAAREDGSDVSGSDMLCSSGHLVSKTTTSQPCSCGACASNPQGCRLWLGGGDLFVCPECGTGRGMCEAWVRARPDVQAALVVGNPWPNDHGFLKCAEVEAASVFTELQQTGAFDKVEVATKARAVKPWVLARLRGASWVHLAAHASSDGSTIFLARSDAEGCHGELTMHEVQHSARLKPRSCVVLSACNTGSGSVTPDGVVGLSRGFLAAGAAAVVVSLWSVGDESTKVLMGLFYESLVAGLSAAQAMRRAMLTMADRTQGDIVPEGRGGDSSDSGVSDDAESMGAPLLPTVALLRLPAAGTQGEEGRAATNKWGKHELRSLQLLFNEGEKFFFNNMPLAVNNGIDKSGFLTKEACLALFGARMYSSQVWGADGAAVHRAQSTAVSLGNVKEAVVEILSAVRLRTDLRDRLGADEGHKYMLSQLKAAAQRIKALSKARESGGSAGTRSEGAGETGARCMSFTPRHWSGFVVTGARVWLQPARRNRPAGAAQAVDKEDKAHGSLSVAQVGELLREMELGQYVDAFASNAIDSDMLDELEGLWDDLGVDKRAHQIKILKRFGVRK